MSFWFAIFEIFLSLYQQGPSLEGIYSHVVLRECQQRWFLCDGGWTVFSPENIHHTEIVPERMKRAKEEYQSVLLGKLNLDFIRAALSCQSAAASRPDLLKTGTCGCGERWVSSCRPLPPRRSLDHLLSPNLTLPHEAAPPPPRVTFESYNTTHAQLLHCSCPTCVVLWNMRKNDIKDQTRPIYCFIKPAAVPGITLTKADVSRIVMQGNTHSQNCFWKEKVPLS